MDLTDYWRGHDAGPYAYMLTVAMRGCGLGGWRLVA